jgi:hypothetical protein
MTQVIMDWIASLGWDTRQETGFPLYPGPEILDEPDQAVFITGGGGPGFITEEASADSGVFQARVRGPSDQPFAAEIAAQKLDTLITKSTSFPVTIDGVLVSLASRLSNGPTPLPVDPDDLRHEFTCSYIFVTGA